MLFLDLETSCTSQTLSSVMGFVGRLLDLIGIIVPILLMIMLTIKIAKVVRNPDDKKLQPQIKNSIMAAIVVFMIPVITNACFSMLGEKTNISSCWLLAKSNSYTINSPQYIAIEKEKRNSIYNNPEDYQKGVPKPEPTPTAPESNTPGNNTPATTISGGTTLATGNRLVEVGRTQIGVPYHSMHYGPKGSGHDGFGCAMFVSYCYNQVFFGGVSGQEMGLGGFYGSTYEYWGNVTRDGYNPHNKKFVEVASSQAQPGDVVAFLRGGDHYASYSNCYHVGLYAGNGNIIDSSDAGVQERPININNGDLHFLRYMGRE